LKKKGGKYSESNNVKFKKQRGRKYQQAALRRNDREEAKLPRGAELRNKRKVFLHDKFERGGRGRLFEKQRKT